MVRVEEGPEALRRRVVVQLQVAGNRPAVAFLAEGFRTSSGDRLQSTTSREYPASTAGASRACARPRASSPAPMSQAMCCQLGQFGQSQPVQGAGNGAAGVVADDQGRRCPISARTAKGAGSSRRAGWLLIGGSMGQGGRPSGRADKGTERDCTGAAGCERQTSALERLPRIVTRSGTTAESSVSDGRGHSTPEVLGKVGDVRHQQCKFNTVITF